MYCKVKNCRFKSKHTTFGHRCGKCNKYGHGQAECGNQLLIDDLLKYKDDKLPVQLQCTHRGCKRKWSHVSEGHFCHKCYKNHHSSECVIQSIYETTRRYNINLDNEVQLLNNSALNNIYISVYMGMGCMLFVKKKDNILNSLYMHCDNWGQYGPETDYSDVYAKFINNCTEIIKETTSTYKCPYCRSENSIDKVLKIKAMEQKCCVCLDNNIEVYSPECEHSVLCNDCFMKLCN